MPALRRVCVFCGSSSGTSPVYRDAAENLACVMVMRGIGLVFGGGCVRFMGVADDADPTVLLDKLSLPLAAPEPKWIRTTEET